MRCIQKHMISHILMVLFYQNVIVLRIQIQERKLIEILLKEIEIESYILKHFDG